MGREPENTENEILMELVVVETMDGFVGLLGGAVSKFEKERINHLSRS